MDWRKRRENRDYYRGPWRKDKITASSEAQKNVAGQVGVQDSIILHDAARQRLKRTLPHLSLVDVIIPENVLLLGLIAENTNVSVQDLIDKTLPRLFSRGKQVLNSWLLSKVQKPDARLPE